MVWALEAGCIMLAWAWCYCVNGRRPIRRSDRGIDYQGEGLD